jgi:hypothetical protein
VETNSVLASGEPELADEDPAMRASAASSSQYPLQGVSESRVLSDEVPVPSVVPNQRQLRKGNMARKEAKKCDFCNTTPSMVESSVTEYRLTLVTPQCAVKAAAGGI